MSGQTFIINVADNELMVRLGDVIVPGVRVTVGTFGTIRVAGGVSGPQGVQGNQGPIGNTGPQGVQGSQGPQGTAGSGLDFQFNSPNVEWLINHNLGYKPVIDLFTTGGVEMLAAVIHTSLNQVLVQFNSPQAGSARLV